MARRPDPDRASPTGPRRALRTTRARWGADPDHAPAGRARLPGRHVPGDREPGDPQADRARTDRPGTPRPVRGADAGPARATMTAQDDGSPCRRASEHDPQYRMRPLTGRPQRAHVFG